MLKKKIFFRKSKRREDGFSKRESGLSEKEEIVCKENYERKIVVIGM